MFIAAASASGNRLGLDARRHPRLATAGDEPLGSASHEERSLGGCSRCDAGGAGLGLEIRGYVLVIGESLKHKVYKGPVSLA